MENYKELQEIYRWAAETEAADNKKLDTYHARPTNYNQREADGTVRPMR